MGATAVVSSSAAGSSSTAGVSASVTSLLSPVGVGVGSVVVALALVYVLAHLDVISARPNANERTRQLLIASAIPLGVAFAATVAFRTLQIL